MSKIIIYHHCGPATKLYVFIIKANSVHYQYTEHTYPYKYGVYSYIKLLFCGSFTMQKKNQHCSQKKTIWEFLNQVRTNIKIVIFPKWNSPGLALQPSNVLTHEAGNRCSRRSINTFSIKTPVCKASVGKDRAWELQLNSRSAIQFLTSGTDGK